MRTEKRTTDGREIIAREPAYAPHPHPRHNGKLVQVAGVTKILLDDGSEQHECDQCGKVFKTATSAVAHLPSHGDHKPQYPLDVLRQVIREVLLAKRAGGKDFCARAAEKLNAAQVPTAQGKPWSGVGVSYLYNRYKNEVRVRVSGGREVKPVSAPPNQRTASTSDVNTDIADQVARIKLALDQVCGQLGDLGEAIARVGQAIAALPAIDSQAIEDARRFRELQKLMGGGS